MSLNANEVEYNAKGEKNVEERKRLNENAGPKMKSPKNISATGTNHFKKSKEV